MPPVAFDSAFSLALLNVTSRQSPAKRTEADQPSDEAVQRAKDLLVSRIGEFRRARGLSLGELATEVGVTSAMASQIERGVTTPSMSTLSKIAAALGVSMAQLFEIENPDSTVVRFEDREVIEHPGLGINDKVISSDLSMKLLVLESTISAGRHSGSDLAVHGAEVECVLVLEGSIEIKVGTNQYCLAEGDSLTFQGKIAHGFSNPNETPARVLWIMTPGAL